MTITNAEGEEEQKAPPHEWQNFWKTTSNKQPDFFRDFEAGTEPGTKA